MEVGAGRLIAGNAQEKKVEASYMSVVLDRGGVLFVG